MKKRLGAFGALALIAGMGAAPAHAEVGALIGLSFTMGGNIGVHASALSSNRPQRGVVGAGISWYPMNTFNPVGLTLGIGYQERNWGVIGGWDFLQNNAFAAGGYAATRRR